MAFRDRTVRRFRIRIVRTRVRRWSNGRSCDKRFATTLRVDAVPGLLDQRYRARAAGMVLEFDWEKQRFRVGRQPQDHRRDRPRVSLSLRHFCVVLRGRNIQNESFPLAVLQSARTLGLRSRQYRNLETIGARPVNPLAHERRSRDTRPQPAWRHPATRPDALCALRVRTTPAASATSAWGLPRRGGVRTPPRAWPARARKSR